MLWDSRSTKEAPTWGFLEEINELTSGGRKCVKKGRYQNNAVALPSLGKDGKLLWGLGQENDIFA